MKYFGDSWRGGVKCYLKKSKITRFPHPFGTWEIATCKEPPCALDLDGTLG